ncbi:MAG TPA: mechanosensitive ion channel family protein [Candidatus Polarisedimenticolia bacterium]|nr:mechanosensitive ion channel family protein [Candidatus Polarisedimenticolia bacterium]
MPSAPDTLATVLQSPWFKGGVAFVLWVGFFLIAHYFANRALRRLAARTSWEWDDLLIDALRRPVVIAILASGLVILGRILPLEAEWDRAFDVMLAAALVLAIVLFVDHMTSGLLERMAAKHTVLQGARGLVLGSMRGVIIGIGVLIFLDSIGISIAPILASLGVGSLAVALALQDTLANIFAGFHLIADKPIEAGQFIKLQSGEEGHVVKVGWRTTWITTPQKNTVVVPNSKLSGAVLTNYDMPSTESVFTVDVVVASTDLEKVEQVALEVARRAIAEVAGATRGFEPVARFTGFAESGVQLKVALSAATLADSHVLRHEYLKRLAARFRQEGIVIPFPTRTLDIPPGTFAGLPAGETRGATRPGGDARA